MEKQSASTGEIVLYNVNEKISLEVHLEQETVWLSQSQMAELFQTTKQNVSLHINNCFKESELQRESVVKVFLTTASDGKQYKTFMYNLDVIISVGYRVKSIRGTQFRQWANKVLKDYLLKGYNINYQLASIEENLQNHTSQIHDLQEKIDFFVQTSLPPVQGIFYNGQIFDAYYFAQKNFCILRVTVISPPSLCIPAYFSELVKRTKSVPKVALIDLLSFPVLIRCDAEPSFFAGHFLSKKAPLEKFLSNSSDNSTLMSFSMFFTISFDFIIKKLYLRYGKLA